VFWQVNGAASIGATVTSAGTLIAHDALAVGAGTMVNGRAFALTGALTLDANEFYTAPPAVALTGGATAHTSDTTPDDQRHDRPAGAGDHSRDDQRAEPPQRDPVRAAPGRSARPCWRTAPTPSSRREPTLPATRRPRRSSSPSTRRCRSSPSTADRRW
jgi:hypothetical protein